MSYAVTLCKTRQVDTDSDQHAVFADGAMTIASRRDAGDFAVTLSQRYDLPISTTLEFIGDVQDEFYADNAQKSRVADLLAMDFMKKVFMAMIQFKGSTRMINEIALYALGQEHLIPAQPAIRSQQDLAVRWKCKKANIAKNLKWLQEICGIPERPDQRNSEAREAMERSRRRQLVKN